MRSSSAAAQRPPTPTGALVHAIRTSLAAQGLPQDSVCLLDQDGHDAARALMTARGLVDLVIPRGGADLIRTVVMESTVPVIETGIGICHVTSTPPPISTWPPGSSTQDPAPSVCNAAESLLVHREVADAFLPKALTDLGAGVRLHLAADVARMPTRPGGIRAGQRGGLRHGVALA